MFLCYFLRLLHNYQRFVIQPQCATSAAEGGAQARMTYATWATQRDLMQNFDKYSFLSEQPPHTQPFLAAFLETQTFSTFIDLLIIHIAGTPLTSSVCNSYCNPLAVHSYVFVTCIVYSAFLCYDIYE